MSVRSSRSSRCMTWPRAIEPRFRALILVAAFCGLCKSECFGLARRHVDLDGAYPRLIVERQRNEVSGKGLV